MRSYYSVITIVTVFLLAIPTYEIEVASNYSWAGPIIGNNPFNQGLLSSNYTPIRPEHRAPAVNFSLTATLPTAFDWSDLNGVNYVTHLHNQHLPAYCGGCWSFALAAALSDRIKYMRNAAWPDIVISPQVLLSCNTNNHGCNGGDPNYGMEYIANFGLPEENCSPARGYGWENGMPCSQELKCGVCGDTGCQAVEYYRNYKISSYNHIMSESDMATTIYQYGPIVCSIAITQAFLNFTGPGVFIDTTNATNPEHVIEVIGWGVYEGTDYWHIRNHWGPSWGDDGFGKLLRGQDNLGIGMNGCGYMIPIDSWTGQSNASLNSFSGSTFLSENDIKNPMPSLKTKDPATYAAKRLNLTNSLEAVQSFTWQNNNGVNYLSWTRSQNSPNSCNGGWVFSVTSMIADMLNIANGAQFPILTISPQAILNCMPGGSTCNGGTPDSALKWLETNKALQDSCQNYFAGMKQCISLYQCEYCSPPIPENMTTTDVGTCWAVETPGWEVSSWNTLDGVSSMQSIIQSNGPIVCGIYVSSEFISYTGGIYQGTEKGSINHYVSLVGWGTDGTTPYWVGRNSWGEYWGEWGYFRIAMGSNLLDIESECYTASLTMIS